MIDPPFRSPRDRVGGLYYFGRMLDKIRCHLRDELPKEYRPNFGLSVGMDGMDYREGRSQRQKTP